MPTYAWFFIGGGFSLAISVFNMVRNPAQTVGIFQSGHPIQGLAFSFVAGAAIYGTVLWLVFGA